MLKYMETPHKNEEAFPTLEPAPPRVHPEDIRSSATLSKNRYDAASWGGHETGGGGGGSITSSSTRSSSNSSSSNNHPLGWDTMHQEHDMPSSSTSWRGSDGIAGSNENHCTLASAQQKTLLSTPPLSPSSSVVSDVLNRNSSNSFTDPTTSYPRGKTMKTMMTTGTTKSALPSASGDVNFVTGPPIIPRSRTPPPQDHHHQHLLSEESAKHHQRHLKSIFDSDDDGDDGDVVNDVDFELFFNEFSRIPSESKRHSNKRKSIKLRRMSKFNLTAFANHLHQNRLSVMQLRESRILLTGEDELELTRLLEQRKSMMPGAGVPPMPLPPPSTHLPPLPNFEEEVAQGLSANSNTTAERTSATAASLLPPPPSVVIVSDEFEKTEQTPVTTLSKKASRRRQVVRKSLSMDEIHRIGVVGQDKSAGGDMETIQEDTAAAVVEGPPETEEENDNRQLQEQHIPPSSPSSTPPPVAPEPSVSTSYLKSKFELGSGTRAKAIGLFGSLRHATSRSTPFKGLVRNLSSASLSARYSQGGRAAAAAQRKEKEKESEQDQQPEDCHRHHHRLFQNKKKNRGDLEESSNTMSPAARAVMQLDKKKEKKTAAAATAAPETSTSTEKQPHTFSKGGLLTHLLAKAGKARRAKTANMAFKRKDKTKSRIVRRTIIYVPPDSLNHLKNLDNDTEGKEEEEEDKKIMDDKLTAQQPMPTDMSDKLKLHRIETGEQEESDAAEGNYYDDESLYDYYRSRESSLMTATATPQLEGLELRELEDGTIEWGIVKKQGNRKSFYAHGREDLAEEDEDDANSEAHVLKMMGLSVPSTLSLSSTTSPPPPLPRRSPRRRLDSDHDRAAKHISTITTSDASTTDVYYAPQQTLPSLLQMIADQAKEEEDDEQAYLEERRKKQASVEEQLDDMMRSFQRVDY